MNTKQFSVRAIVAAALAFAALVVPAGAHATSQSCPTADIEGTLKVLHPLSYRVSKFNGTTTEKHIFIGSAYPYGLTAMVVVQYGGGTPPSCTADYLVDSSNQGTFGLPQFQTAVCFGDGDSTIDVVNQDMTAAQIDEVVDHQTLDATLCRRAGIATMGPLNYNGNMLAVYGLGGADHMHGGVGVDLMYGGAGQDDVDEGGYVFANVRGYSLGEDEHDYVYGSSADLTVLRGGAGDDAIHDNGGAQDSLFGDEGYECCMEDAGRNWSRLDCGPNGGKTDRLSGTINCTVETGPGVCPGRISCP